VARCDTAHWIAFNIVAAATRRVKVKHSFHVSPMSHLLHTSIRPLREYIP
jgi:hypothetical protein